MSVDALEEVNEMKQSYNTEHQERVKAEGEIKEVCDSKVILKGSGTLCVWSSSRPGGDSSGDRGVAQLEIWVQLN